MHRRLTPFTALTGLALVVPLVVGAPADASGGGADVVRSGSCSSHTDWKVKAKHDDGRIEVEVEVDSNRGGQTWRWRILHNGSLSAHGTATTRPPSGSFSVQRRMTDLAGSDTFRLRATNRRSGEVCHGSVRL
jgi:hypothetical protein